MGSKGVDILLLAIPDEIDDEPMLFLGMPPGLNDISEGAPGQLLLEFPMSAIPPPMRGYDKVGNN